MEIMTDAQLLARIEAFLKRYDIKPSRFGIDAMGDGALVFQLRAGSRSVSLKNAEKIVAFMGAYRPPEREDAAA